MAKKSPMTTQDDIRQKAQDDIQKNSSKSEQDGKKRTPKQIAALFCVILLICLYLFTFIIACLDFPGADKLFPVCLMATIGLPILFWIYIWLYGVTKEKHTMASADLLHSDSLTGTRLSQDAPEISESPKTSGKAASSVSENK